MFGECHAHALMNGVNYREAVALHREKANEEAVRQCLRAYQEAEVSFVRDGGDPYGVASLAARLAPEYGIDYRTPVFAIHRNGHYGEIVGVPSESSGGKRIRCRFHQDHDDRTSGF